MERVLISNPYQEVQVNKIIICVVLSRKHFFFFFHLMCSHYVLEMVLQINGIDFDTTSFDEKGISKKRKQKRNLVQKSLY